MKTGQRFDVFIAFLSSARFITALTTTTITASVLAFALRQTVGWAGLFGILGGILALWTVILLARRGEIEWSGLLPISLMVFVGWAAASLLWSNYQWASLGGIVYLLCFTVLGVAVALLRDTIQIVRSFGDAFRFALFASLTLEIIAGLLIDSPIRFLGITAHLDQLGPIQGLFGTRNQLGIVALIALVTFATEVRTRSVTRGLGIGSIVLASACLLLSQSPVAIGSGAILGVASLAMFGMRRIPVDRRPFFQFGLLTLSVVALVVTWVFRGPIVGFLDATKDLSYRLELWRRVLGLTSLHSLEGWGWVGAWRNELEPFTSFRDLPGAEPMSAANAYIDVWFQLGIVGLVALGVLVSLAFVRSWLLAIARRSVVFAWPALVLLALIASSLAESSLLVEFGWLALVVCTVKASRELSWRQAFTTAPTAPELPSHPG